MPFEVLVEELKTGRLADEVKERIQIYMLDKFKSLKIEEKNKWYKDVGEEVIDIWFKDKFEDADFQLYEREKFNIK